MYRYYGNLPLEISTVFSSPPMPQGCTGGGGGNGGGTGGIDGCNTIKLRCREKRSPVFGVLPWISFTSRRTWVTKKQKIC